jgi:UPF0716 protein FxsA
MPILLFVLFLVVPVVELWVLIQVGQVIGPPWTVALLLAVSVLGTWLIRREGTRAWTAFRLALARGRVPANEVLDGALVLLGGALLLTPGFVTDVVGLLLVFPPTRRVASRALRGRVRARLLHAGTTRARSAARPPRPPARGRQTGTGGAVDVEVLDVRREDPRR